MSSSEGGHSVVSSNSPDITSIAQEVNVVCMYTSVYTAIGLLKKNNFFPNYCF
jgi:hypothetical protein